VLESTSAVYDFDEFEDLFDLYATIGVGLSMSRRGGGRVPRGLDLGTKTRA
jgi:hypothetical protein